MEQAFVENPDIILTELKQFYMSLYSLTQPGNHSEKMIVYWTPMDWVSYQNQIAYYEDGTFLIKSEIRFWIV